MCARFSSGKPETLEIIVGSISNPSHIEVCEDYADHLVRFGDVKRADVYPIPLTTSS